MERIKGSLKLSDIFHWGPWMSVQYVSAIHPNFDATSHCARGWDWSTDQTALPFLGHIACTEFYMMLINADFFLGGGGNKVEQQLHGEQLQPAFFMKLGLAFWTRRQRRYFLKKSVQVCECVCVCVWMGGWGANNACKCAPYILETDGAVKTNL